MKKRRRPIYIQAAIEPEGARIIGEGGGSELPIDKIISWNRVDNSSAIRFVYDENNEKLEIDGHRIVLRFGSTWKSQSKTSQQLIKKYKQDWYRNPVNEFEIDTLPSGVRSAAFGNAYVELVFGTIVLLTGAQGFIPALNRPNPIARTIDHWVMLGIVLLGLFLLLSGILIYFRTLNASWVVSMRHDGVKVRTHEQERWVPWSNIRMLRRKMVLQLLMVDERETAYVFPTQDIWCVLGSRLHRARPKLFTLGFFIIFFLALMSGPIVFWFFQYLQIPMNISWVGVSGVSLFLSGILVLQYSLELKEFRKANESADREIPMSS